MPNSKWHQGRRISYGNALCTVRYHGPLQDTKGEWLGVEWDDPSRGKHDGQHLGKQIFDCLSASLTAGSFVRPTRLADTERTLLEAIHFKYGYGLTSGLLNPGDNDVVMISGKVAEEVGFDKIAKAQSQLADLKIVLLDQLVVTGIAPRDSSAEDIKLAQNELLAKCPSIIELDLGSNPIESWQDIADICTALPKLKILKANSLRLKSFALLDQGKIGSPFSRIQELQLNGSILLPRDIITLLNKPVFFSNLRALTLSQNELTTFQFPTSSPVVQVPSITTLSLENNKLTDLSSLAHVFTMFPNLSNISLRGNCITDIGKSTSHTQSSFPTLNGLNLFQNRINSFAFVDALPSLFPNLSELRISKNPVYDIPASGPATNGTAADTSYYLTLARIPTLKTLNYTTITTRDREEGEIYYMSIAERQIKALLSRADNDKVLPSTEIEHTIHSLFPRYQSLCEKYDRDSIFMQLSSDPQHISSQIKDSLSTASYPAGSAGSRLVKGTFYLANTDPTVSITRAIPSTIPVNTLKALLMRLPTFTPTPSTTDDTTSKSLPPLQFRLIYESPDLDPVEPVEWTTRSAAYDRTIPRERRWHEWGTWDADEIVANASKADSTKGEETIVQEDRVDGDGYIVRDGQRWRKREVEIVNGSRAWGDWIEDAKEVRVRIEPL